MRWNRHFEVEGRHAYLGASKYHWINYDLEKVKRVWENQFASQDGVRKHKLAAFLIEEKVRLERNSLTLNLYVNDAIGFRMTPEQPLVYSENVFGTPDAISFHDRELRIHDLKTGVHPGSFHQLEVYAALFCHEYKQSPFDIVTILRIYQNDQFYEMIANPNEIKRIMDKMDEFDPEINKMKELMA